MAPDCFVRVHYAHSEISMPATQWDHAAILVLTARGAASIAGVPGALAGNASTGRPLRYVLPIGPAPWAMLGAGDVAERGAAADRCAERTEHEHARAASAGAVRRGDARRCGAALRGDGGATRSRDR